MLGYFFAALVLLSIIFAAASGRVPETAQAVMTGAGDAVTVCVGLAGAICLWSGVMKVAERAGLTSLLSKALSPVLRRLLPSLGKGSEGERAVCMNVSANILGLGNAATPYGLKAMRYMAERSPCQGAATRDMVVFTVLNTASVQVLPTTVAALRAAAGASSPFDILPAVWVTSLSAAVFGVLLACVTASGLKSGKRKAGRRSARVSALTNINT